MKTAAIIPGIFEGKLHGRKLEASLRASGYDIISDWTTADMVISHSGGYYLIDKPLQASRVLLVNPSMGPLYMFPIVLAKKTYLDFTDCLKEHMLKAWAIKTLLNFLYIAIHPLRNLRIALRSPQFQYRLPEFSGQVTVINNADDPWAKNVPQHEIDRLDYTFETLPGCHDDLWLHPERYIAT